MLCARLQGLWISSSWPEHTREIGRGRITKRRWLVRCMLVRYTVVRLYVGIEPLITHSTHSKLIPFLLIHPTPLTSTPHTQHPLPHTPHTHTGTQCCGEGYGEGYQPLTTKAGSRLWSIGFAEPGNMHGPTGVDGGGCDPPFTQLRASYPLQVPKYLLLHCCIVALLLCCFVACS
jgi:hypothetical protein